MTKEPIMIDDVDVSECKLYVPTLNQCILDYGSCDKNKNCYYKQLKRKEQECEELLKFNNSLVEEHKTIGNDLYKEIKDYRIKLDQLKVENKEYKDIINKLAGKTIAITSYDKPFEFCDHKDLTIKQLKLDKETYKYQWEKQYKLCEYWQGQAEKFKQALQKIKEVIKQEGYINKKTQIFKGSVLYQAMEDLKLPDKKILKIINEVLNV